MSLAYTCPMKNVFGKKETLTKGQRTTQINRITLINESYPRQPRYDYNHFYKDTLFPIFIFRTESYSKNTSRRVFQAINFLSYLCKFMEHDTYPSFQCALSENFIFRCKLIYIRVLFKDSSKQIVIYIHMTIHLYLSKIWDPTKSPSNNIKSKSFRG